MLVLRALELAAGGTFVLVVLGVDVAQADGGFKVPAFAQNPRITVGEPGACRPPLVAVVLGGLVLEKDAHTADVVESVTAVQAEEMAIITFA